MLQGSQADLADAGRGELVGDLGEGLRVDVLPVGDLAVWQHRGSPVGGDCRGLRVALSCVGVLFCLTGAVVGRGQCECFATTGGKVFVTYSRTA